MDFNLSVSSFATVKNVRPIDTTAVYDVLILGGGPAGLTAAVYCMRKGVSTAIVLSKTGGQVAETAGIENYLGYRYINGSELADKFREQVIQFGIAYDEGSSVTTVEAGPPHRALLADGRTVTAKTVIIATGKSWRHLGVPGEAELAGKGVAYCATCDAPLFAGREVVVVGGGNSAIEAVLDLGRVGATVTMVQFLEHLTGDAILVDRLKEVAGLSILLNHEVAHIDGADAVDAVTVRDRSTGAERSIAARGVFVEIGMMPNSQPFRELCRLNDAGEVMVDSAGRTSRPGVFAAGDITDVPYKQIIIAAGAGATAALAACDYLLGL